MKISILPAFLFLFLLGSGSARADTGSITIFAPENNATVSQHDNVELNFEAVPRTDGDHLHLNIDGKLVDIIRALKGKTSIGMLDPGKHHICLSINTKGHTPTGVQKCIDVTSK